jgi:hypothetical protein
MGIPVSITADGGYVTKPIPMFTMVSHGIYDARLDNYIYRDIPGKGKTKEFTFFSGSEDEKQYKIICTEKVVNVLHVLFNRFKERLEKAGVDYA